ncbi:phosphohexomutase domain-containing protein [Anaerosinus massiliensis]|uniref:phosphomannomutase/phosphoglucomutase n=1 Tax=Massilibacillus massiliensis TaxID=1806837 RepID=UPI000ABE3C17|nr:phosphomannomutase/phosphoglucomutase [Massilibacillus massiliensis]
MNSSKSIMKLQNGSDVRGVAVEGITDEPVNLFPETANRIAGGFVLFLAQTLGKDPADIKIAVGHDSRISASELKCGVLEGITAKGSKAVDCGLASTPAMFMSIVFEETKMDGAIMITASHLPYNRNGLKFFTKHGGLNRGDITAVLESAEGMRAQKGCLAEVEKLALIDIYAKYLCEKICAGVNAADYMHPLKGMHIVVDAGNGGGGFFASKVLKELGADITGSVFLEPDGMFPNHIPNPEDKKAMQAIQGAVLNSKADLGLIFDTDVDRMSAVLSTGEEINRNALIAMMAAILAPDYPGSTIVTDSVTSDELKVFLEKELGLKHHRYMRGYKNVINECIRLNENGTVSPLAIETSGHGALHENYYLDDGAYLAVKLLIAAARLKGDGKPLGALVEKLGHPQEAREYRLYMKGITDFQAYGKQVLQAFEERASARNIQIATPSFEGVRLVFEDGWALLRMSLHDPNMPLNIESRHAGGCDKILHEVGVLLTGFDGLDMSVFKDQKK